MNKCQDILKIVRGNSFTLCLQVEARRTDGTAVEDFTLQGDEVLKLLHNGTAETKPYETVGNSVFVIFDGDDDLGWYGLEMTGLFHDEPWRWCVPKVFQIVETNDRANLPSWTFLADDTYIIGCGITLLSAVIHADWDETDTSAPSYIKNKPDLNEYALVTDLLATNQRVSTLDNTAVKTVMQSFSDLQKNTARNNISAASVAQVNAKQDTISDLSTIRSGAADGAVARGYLNDFSTATHTPAAQVGQVLATVATQANGAQPRLTAGDNITITEDNVISATGGGGSADAVLYTPQTLTTAQQTQARTNISAYTKPSGGIPSTDLSSAVQTSLGKADTAKQEDNVFWATYGTTTATDIMTAYNAGKVCCVYYDNRVYRLELVGSSTIQFTCVTQGNLYSVVVNRSTSAWSNSTISFEQTTNKKTTITGNESSTTYYPTTKAVADYVSGIVGDINTILDEINGEVI